MTIYSEDYTLSSESLYVGSDTTAYDYTIPEQSGEVTDWIVVDPNQIQWSIPELVWENADSSSAIHVKLLDTDEVTLGITGDTTVDVMGDTSVHVTGDTSIQVTGDTSVQVTGDTTLDIGETWNVLVGSTLAVECSDMTLTSGSQQVDIVSSTDNSVVVWSQRIDQEEWSTRSDLPYHVTVPDVIQEHDNVTLQLGNTYTIDMEETEMVFHVDGQSFIDHVEQQECLVGITGIEWHDLTNGNHQTNIVVDMTGRMDLQVPQEFRVYDQILDPDPSAVALTIHTGTQKVTLGCPVENTVLPLSDAALRIVRTDVRESSVEWIHNESLGRSEWIWQSVNPLTGEQTVEAQNGSLDLMNDCPHEFLMRLPGRMRIEPFDYSAFELTYDSLRLGTTEYRNDLTVYGNVYVNDHLIHGESHYTFPALLSASDTDIIVTMDAEQTLSNKKLNRITLDWWFDSTDQVVHGPITAGSTRTLVSWDGDETLSHKTIVSAECQGTWTWTPDSQLNVPWIQRLDGYTLVLGATYGEVSGHVHIDSTYVNVMGQAASSGDIPSDCTVLLGGQIHVGPSTVTADTNPSVVYRDVSNVVQRTVDISTTGIVDTYTHRPVIHGGLELHGPHVLELNGYPNVYVDRYLQHMSGESVERVWVGSTWYWMQRSTASEYTISHSGQSSSTWKWTSSGCLALRKGATYVPTETLEINGKIVTDNDLTSTHWRESYDHSQVQYSNPHLVSLEQCRQVDNQVDDDVVFTLGTVTGLPLPGRPSDAANKAYVDSFLQGVYMQQSIITRTLNVPPANPTAGDRYVVAAGGTGAWEGLDNSIVDWRIDSSNPVAGIPIWFTTPATSGMITFAIDEQCQLIFVGTEWKRLSSLTNHSELQNLAADDHLQYARLNGRSGGQVLSGGTQPADHLYLESTRNHLTGAGSGAVRVQSQVGGNVTIGTTHAAVSSVVQWGANPTWGMVGTETSEFFLHAGTAQLSTKWSSDSIWNLSSSTDFHVAIQGQLGLGTTGPHRLTVSGTTDTDTVQCSVVAPRPSPDSSPATIELSSDPAYPVEFQLISLSDQPCSLVWSQPDLTDQCWYQYVNDDHELAWFYGSSGLSEVTSGLSLGTTRLLFTDSTMTECTYAVESASWSFQLNTRQWLSVIEGTDETEGSTIRFPEDNNDDDEESANWLSATQRTSGLSLVCLGHHTGTSLTTDRPFDVGLYGTLQTHASPSVEWDTVTGVVYGTHFVTSVSGSRHFRVGDTVTVTASGQTVTRTIESVGHETSADPTGYFETPVYVHSVTVSYPFVARQVVDSVTIEQCPFRVLRSDDTPMLSMVSSGWIGVGQTIPEAPLHVTIPTDDSTPVWTTIMGHSSGTLSFLHQGGAAGYFNLQQSTGTYTLRIDNLGDPLFVLTPDGSLGVGTEPTRGSLDIVGDGLYVGQWASDTNQADWGESEAPDGVSAGHESHLASAPALFQGSDGDTRVSGVETVGLFVGDECQQQVTADSVEFTHNLIVHEYVGIGTTTPNDTLDVVGNIRCTKLVTTSDRRLKEDIHDPTHADMYRLVQLFQQVDPQLYRWKSDPSRREHWGLMAQDIEEVEPRLITKRDDGTLQVETTDMVSVLWGYCQHLTQRLQRLESLVADPCVLNVLSS